MCLGNSLTARNSSENAEKSELGVYILTNVTSCEPAWTSVIWYFPLQFDLVKMCLKFTLLLTRITTSCNGRAPENRLPCSPTSHPPSVHFLATNTIKLITTEIGQNVFSIVANVPLMLHRLPLILVLTFSLIAGATSREKWEGGKAACLDGGALGVSWSVKQRSWTSLGTLWSGTHSALLSSWATWKRSHVSSEH